MKKQYTILEIVAGIINLMIPAIIISNIFLEYVPYDNYKYGFIVGIWAGWFQTRNYYKNKMQSNTQKERK